MKLLLCFLMLLVTCNTLVAQDWKTVNAGNPTYFRVKNEFTWLVNQDTTVDYLRYIKIEGAASIGTDSIFYLPPSYRFTPEPNPDKCIDTFGPSWLGKNFIRSPQGLETYSNRNLAPIFIKTKAGVGDSWLMASIDGKNYTLTVSSADTLTIDGVIDSIKVLTISADSSGNAYTNCYTGHEIVLSKSHGFVSTFEFYGFAVADIFPSGPDYSNQFSLEMIVPRFVTAHQRLPAAFGDMDLYKVDLQWKYKPSNEWIFKTSHTFGIYWVHDSIYSATALSPNAIAVTYRSDTSWYTNYLNQTAWSSSFGTIRHDTFYSPNLSMYVRDTIFPELAMLPKPNPLLNEEMLLWPGVSKACNEGYLLHTEYSRTATSGWSPMQAVCPTMVFGKDYGGLFSQIFYPNFGKYYDSMGNYNPQAQIDWRQFRIYDYANLDGCVQGAKYDIYLNTGLRAESARISHFDVMPNPARNQITMSLPAGLAIIDIKVYNAFGQLVKCPPLSATQLDISQLVPGFYVVTIVTDEGAATCRFKKEH
jgi:hypothetical protein